MRQVGQGGCEGQCGQTQQTEVFLSRARMLEESNRHDAVHGWPVHVVASSQPQRVHHGMQTAGRAPSGSTRRSSKNLAPGPLAAISLPCQRLLRCRHVRQRMLFLVHQHLLACSPRTMKVKAIAFVIAGIEA